MYNMTIRFAGEAESWHQSIVGDYEDAVDHAMEMIGASRDAKGWDRLHRTGTLVTRTATVSLRRN